MDAVIERLRSLDPTTFVAGAVGFGVLLAYAARWWWTAPIVRGLARVEDALRRRG